MADARSWMIVSIPSEEQLVPKAFDHEDTSSPAVHEVQSPMDLEEGPTEDEEVKGATGSDSS